MFNIVNNRKIKIRVGNETQIENDYEDFYQISIIELPYL